MIFTLFEYRYRDGGNFKVNGTVLLSGAVSAAEEEEAIGHFQDQELFIAEQLGIPPLYVDLYRWSNGPIADDHCWHEFVRFKAVSTYPVQSDPLPLCEASVFLNRIASVSEWNCALSPHAFLPAIDRKAIV